MDSPVTFNFLSVQEGFIERKCDGAARLHRRKKKDTVSHKCLLHLNCTTGTLQTNVNQISLVDKQCM